VINPNKGASGKAGKTFGSLLFIDVSPFGNIFVNLFTAAARDKNINFPPPPLAARVIDNKLNHKFIVTRQ
jgi:hypothetical protein